MLQPSFHIHQEGLENAELGDTRLIIDAGLNHFAFAILSNQGNKFIALEYFPLKPESREQDLAQLLKEHQLLGLHYKDVLVSFNTKEAILMPGEMYREAAGETMLTMIHGDLPAGNVFQENIPGQDIYCIYRVPVILHQEISQQFTTGHYWHIYSTIIHGLHKRAEELPGSFIYIIFYPNQVVVTVIKEKEPQLIQAFPYDIPEDVTYHLLNISEQLELDNAEIPLLASGLIDSGSALYAELLKYFLQVETDPGWSGFSKDDAFQEYPDHFFTPIFSLALCE